jgi:hypothetical protein
VGGTDTQVQFNDGGSALGGDAGLTYNKTTDTLTAGTINVKSHTGYAGSQLVIYTAATSTTDATPATISTITMSDDTAMWIEVHIVARRTSGGNDRAYYQRTALIYRAGGGSATIQMGVLGTVTVESNASYDSTITTSGNDVLVRVTGVGSTNISWVATIKYQVVVTSS